MTTASPVMSGDGARVGDPEQPGGWQREIESPEEDGAKSSHSMSPPLLFSKSRQQSMDEVSQFLFQHRTVMLTWGDNGNGQLGHADYTNRIFPQPVHYFKSTTLISIQCGSRSTLALDNEGRVYSWGRGDSGTLGTGESGTAMQPRLVERLARHKISSLAIRGSHVLALEENGQIWSWGLNDSQQLGQDEAFPFERTSAPHRIRSLVGVRVTAVACGRTHSVMLDYTGRVWTWGSGADGETGHGDTLSRNKPTKVSALSSRQMVAISCGSRHTLALSSEAKVYSWGWGVYGQLGHGDVLSCHSPTLVFSLRDFKVTKVACGYRHSMVLSSEPQVVWAWGWGRHGQLGLGRWVDEVLPQPVHGLAEVEVKKLCPGGRHSLALCANGRVYSWGRDEDGELGLGVQGARCVPTAVESIATRPLALLDAACGWAHTACLVRAHRSNSVSDLGSASPDAMMVADWNKLRREMKKSVPMPALFVLSDFEGLFGQLLGISIQFMLFETILRKSCGFTHAMLSEELLPGAAASYVSGHLFFAIEATRLSRKSKSPVTGLPQGTNIITFFAFTQLIMGPENDRLIKMGMDSETAARGAYDMGLAACFLLGALELLALPFVNSLRVGIPRAAMLAAISGVSLTFIAMGFAVQVWASPGTAIVSMLLMLLFYAGHVRLPFRIPGGILAVATGCFLSFFSGWLGYDWSDEVHVPPVQATSLHFPQPALGFLNNLYEPSFYRYISVIIPMLLVNLINNLANVEAAAAVGDRYDAQSCLFASAVIDLSGSMLGNPFPSCVYLGHAAFKAMGCRVGYLYLSLVPPLYFGLMQGASVLQRYVPIETGVGFLLWIGLQITASGFEGDPTPEGWRHGPAVAIGLLPSLSAWSWQMISTTFAATRDLLCETEVGHSGQKMSTSAPEMCAMELSEIIQKASTPIDVNSPLADFQWQISSLFLPGLYALANGYLLTAIVLSSMLVHMIEGNFNKSATWLMLAAAASCTGIMHSPVLDPYQANQIFPMMYLVAAIFLWVCHVLREHAEKIRELQVVLNRHLQPVLRFCKCVALERAISITNSWLGRARTRMMRFLPFASTSRTEVPPQPLSEVGRYQGHSAIAVDVNAAKTQVKVCASSQDHQPGSMALFDELDRSLPLLQDYDLPSKN